IYWWLYRNSWLACLLGVSIILQSTFLTGEYVLAGAWVLVPILILYALGDWINDRNTGYPLQASSLTAAFIMAGIGVMIDHEWTTFGFDENQSAESLAFLVIVGVLLVISGIAKWQTKRWPASGFEWLL